MAMQTRYVASLAASVFLGAAIATAADLPQHRRTDDRDEREELFLAPAPADRARLASVREGSDFAGFSIVRLGRRGDILWVLLRREGARGRIGLVLGGASETSPPDAGPTIVSRDLDPVDVARLSPLFAGVAAPPLDASVRDP